MAVAPVAIIIIVIVERRTELTTVWNVGVRVARSGADAGPDGAARPVDTDKDGNDLQNSTQRWADSACGIVCLRAFRGGGSPMMTSSSVPPAGERGRVGQGRVGFRV